MSEKVIAADLRALLDELCNQLLYFNWIGTATTHTYSYIHTVTYIYYSNQGPKHALGSSLNDHSTSQIHTRYKYIDQNILHIHTHCS